MDTISNSPRATLIELPGDPPSHSGPQVGCESEDLNATLLSWKSGEGTPGHVNTEVDVVIAVLEGAGEIIVDGAAFGLRAGQSLLIPKNCERQIRCVGERLSYLSVHKRRRGLMPTPIAR
jgi:quercetin dioxygenase-like cupin family protein